MQYVVMINKDTQIVNSFMELTVESYSHQQIVDNNIIILLDERPGDVHSLVTNKYYKDDSFKELPDKSNEFMAWDIVTEQWIEPVDFIKNYQAKELKAINQLASDKILARYPLYKQLNTARTEQAQVMYDWIDSIRLAANNAQNEVTIATTVVAIRSITLAFTRQLALL